MLNKNISTAILIACMSFIMPTSAMADWIVRQTEAVEAEHVSVKKDDKKETVTVLIRGCDTCPMELMTNDSTKYFMKQKQIKGKKIDSLSGRPGTVIYDADKALVIRVRW